MHSGDGEDARAALIERRWFASIAAVRATREECEVLRQVMETAEDAWRRARTELARLESLRDALGEALAERESETGGSARPRRAEQSALRASAA
jgi:hypothetical protein